MGDAFRLHLERMIRHKPDPIKLDLARSIYEKRHEIYFAAFGFLKDIETGTVMMKGFRYDLISQKYIGKFKPPDKDRIIISIKMFIFSKSMYLARLKIN